MARFSGPVRWAIGVYLVGLHVVVALPHLEPALADVPPVPAIKPERLIPKHFWWQDPQVPGGATVYLGDSITAGLVAPGVNFGISGATSADVLNVIEKLPSVKRAGVVYLAVGVNDVHDGLPGTAERFMAIAAAIPAGTSVVWSAVLPSSHPRISAEAVQRINEAAQAACNSRPRCRFVAAPEWRADYLLEDGVHLSAAGYAAWLEALP